MDRKPREPVGARTGVEKLFTVIAAIGAILIAVGVLGVVSGRSVLGGFAIAVGCLDLYAGVQVRRHVERLRADDST